MDDTVADGSEIQHTRYTGIGRKQMGHSSLGGVLEQGLVAYLGSTMFAWFFVLRPMLPLALGVVLRLVPPSLPHSAQQSIVSMLWSMGE